MKKIISLLISFCVLISLLYVPAEAAESDNKKLNRAISVLQALDMINDDYDELTIIGDEYVTRAEFANVAAGIFAKNLKSDKLYFHDVAREHWAFEKVSVLLETDIIKLNDEKRFYPDSYIRRVDAARMVLRALGYGYIVDAVTTTDEDVLSTAQRAGIFDSTSYSEILKLSDMFVLLYNTLLCETMEMSGMSENKIVYKKSGETYLEKYYSIYMEEGVLEGFDGAAVNSSITLKNQALISGVKFKAEDFDFSGLVGADILYLFEYNKDFNERTLLWIEVLGDDNDRLTLDYYDNSVEFNDNTYAISYYEGNRKKIVNLEKSVSVIYNGEFVRSGVSDILSSSFYSMTLVRKKSESRYSTVIILDYENIVVSGVDSINEIVYDKLSRKPVDFRDAKIDRLEIIKADGGEGEFSNIKNGDVLSIFKSANGERLRVLISNTSKEGIIEKLEIDDGYTFVSLGDTRYRTLKKNLNFGANVGESVVLYIDALGYIADFEYLSSKSTPAFLLKVFLSEDDETLSMKLVDKSGSAQTLRCDKKLKIDGIRYKSSNDAYRVLGGANMLAQIVVFNKNEEGVVTDIDTLERGNESDASLHMVNDYDNNLFKSWGMLGSKMNLNSSTMVFGIPDDLSNLDADDIEVKKISDMKNDEYYVSSSYATKENVEYEEIVVVRGYNWNRPLASKPGVLVSRIYQAVNEENEVVDVLKGYQGSAEVQILCDDKCSLTEAGVQKGDFVIISQNSKGEITDAVIKYSPSGTFARPVTKLTNVSSLVTSGYAKKVIGNMVEVGYESRDDYDCRFDFTRGTVLVYDSGYDEIKEGTVGDVVANDVIKGEGSFIVAQYNWSSPVVFIIYK